MVVEKQPVQADTMQDKFVEDKAIEVVQLSKSFSSGQSGGFLLRTDGLVRMRERFFSKRSDEPKNDAKDAEKKNRHLVLENVNFDVKRGEFFGVIGRNGAGKTTLLRIISGILKEDAGRATVNGRMTAILAMGAGFNAQLTGRQNIYLNSAMQGVMPENVEPIEKDIIAFAELEKDIDRPIKYFSTGMRARLGFSIATHILTDIILLDEALSAGGDIRFQDKSTEYLSHLKEEGRTILIVSHALGLVSSMCDTVGWLKDGKIDMVGNSAEVVAAYRQEHQRRKK